MVISVVLLNIFEWAHENHPKLEFALFCVASLGLGVLVTVAYVIVSEIVNDKKRKKSKMAKEEEMKRSHEEMMKNVGGNGKNK